jgi:ribonuclease HII
MDGILTLGIDDAGRGPVIGPMILSGIVLTHAQELLLKEEGVADSKILEHPFRVKLAKMIEKHNEGHFLVVLTAKEIDDSLNSGTNLNTLEAKAMAQIINKLGKKNMKVLIDCPSVNISAWRKKLLSFVNNAESMEIICEHKADANHVSVSAASILAKVKREIEITKLKRQYGNVGSGYPSDPDTQAFLREHGKKLKDSGLFRTTWATWKELFGDGKEKQGKLF